MLFCRSYVCYHYETSSSSYTRIIKFSALFHKLSVASGVSSLETSTIRTKTLTQCAEWSSFAVDYCFVI